MTDTERVDGGYRFRHERDLDHPVEMVWRTLTEPDEMEACWGNRVEIELRPGGRYVTYHQGDVRVEDSIVRVEPPRLLEHTFWSEVNPDARVTWELEPTATGCRLRLTHFLSDRDVKSAMESVAAGDALSTILSRNASGWERIVERLAVALAGRGE